MPAQQLLMRNDVAKELLLINFDDSTTKAYLLARDSVLEADKEISTILERSKLYALKYPIDVKVTFPLFLPYFLHILSLHLPLSLSTTRHILWRDSV